MHYKGEILTRPMLNTCIERTKVVNKIADGATSLGALSLLCIESCELLLALLGNMSEQLQ